MRHSQETEVDGFTGWRQPMPDGRELPLRFHGPAGSAGKKYPLVLHFHGAGSRGEDNLAPLRFARPLLDPKQNREACLILVPQCPAGRWWVDTDCGAAAHRLPKEMTPEMTAAVAAFDEVLKTYPVDFDRIYVYGQSMGAFATWDILCRRPEAFAGAVAVCGGGDENCAAAIASIPVWVFHGARDDAVKVERSRNMVAALRRAGGQPHYTEYPDVAHNAWDYAYTPELFHWLFQQRRSNNMGE